MRIWTHVSSSDGQNTNPVSVKAEILPSTCRAAKLVCSWLHWACQEGVAWLSVSLHWLVANATKTVVSVQGATKIVKVIIEHPNYMAGESTPENDPFFRTEEKSQFSPDVTPLILAAQYNNQNSDPQIHIHVRFIHADSRSAMSQLSTTITRLCRCFCRETTQYHDLTSSRVSVQTASPSKTTILSKGRRRLKLLQNSNNKIKSEQFNLWRMGNPTLPTRTRVVTIPVSLVSHPHSGVLTVYLWIFNTQQFHSNVYKQFPQQNTYWFNNSLPYSTLLCCS